MQAPSSVTLLNRGYLAITLSGPAANVTVADGCMNEAAECAECESVRPPPSSQRVAIHARVASRTGRAQVVAVGLRANASIVAVQNAGRSSGLRLAIRSPPT